MPGTGDAEMQSAKEDFIAESDLPEMAPVAALASMSKMGPQAEPFIDLGVSEEMQGGAPAARLEGASDTIEVVDGAASVERAPVTNLRPEASQNDDMGGAEALLGLVRAPVTFAGAGLAAVPGPRAPGAGGAGSGHMDAEAATTADAMHADAG